MPETIWFTSDTHFNHRNILLSRPQFTSVEEMNELMIERWNARVKRSDRVYHLGDVALGNADAARQILNRLNGAIHLIRGNHEAVAENKKCADRFVWIKDYHWLKLGEQKVYLLHYAMRTWNCMHYGSWHLYGHSHGSLPELPGTLSFDVGVDCWDFAPISYEEVQQKMAGKVFVPVDHHVAAEEPAGLEYNWSAFDELPDPGD